MLLPAVMLEIPLLASHHMYNKDGKRVAPVVPYLISLGKTNPCMQCTKGTFSLQSPVLLLCPGKLPKTLPTGSSLLKLPQP